MGGESWDRSLTVPHRRWHERSFVKAPLADLACGAPPLPSRHTHSPATKLSLTPQCTSAENATLGFMEAPCSNLSSVAH